MINNFIKRHRVGIAGILLVLMFLLGPMNAAHATLTDFLSCWKLDESSGSAADVAGLNTLSNTNTVTYTTGKINNGATFNGSSNYLSIADASQTGLDLTAGNFTFMLWVKFAGFGTNDGNANSFIFKRGANGSGQEQYRFFYESDSGGTNRIWLSVSDDGTNSSQKGVSQNFSTGTFYHVAVTHASDASVHFYVNGSEVTSGATGGSVNTVFNGGGLFYLGTNHGDSGFLNGMEDNVEVYTRVLSSTEIVADYNSGNGTACSQAAAASAAPAQDLIFFAD